MQNDSGNMLWEEMRRGSRQLAAESAELFKRRDSELLI